MDRESMLRRAGLHERPWDIVVIGGGATGVGCALDAASRGLDVLLLEQADFGKGTSGRSTKLIHGGVRYLAQGNIPLVREALAERGTLLKIAPDFVFPQRFLVPCYSRARKLFYLAGLKFYDLLSGSTRLGRTRSLGRDETLSAVPEVEIKGLVGAVEYLDGRFDDTRFLIALVSKAADEGAVLINYAQVIDAVHGSAEDLAEVQYRDLETGKEFAAAARSVISAKGIFTGAPDKRGLAYSQGIHIVLDSEFLDGAAGLLIPKTPDGRVLFAIPWHGKLLVGTTDTPVPEPLLEPTALDSEIDLVLEAASSYLARRPQRSDIRSVFAGIRPLVASADRKDTSKLSREHLVEVSEGGMVTVTGGKWTTYRRMAEEAVDAAIGAGDIRAATACRTADLEIPDRRRSGAEALAKEDPELGAPLSPMFEYTFADAVFAVREEMARTIDDVLSRRTRILYTDAAEAVRLAPTIADLMASELDWSSEKREAELDAFLKLASNYRVSE